MIKKLNFNEIIDKHLSFNDFSLISEASDISADAINDSKNLANKQVRFNADVNYNSFLNSSVISDASLLESESRLIQMRAGPEIDSNYQNNNNCLSYNFADSYKPKPLTSFAMNVKSEVTDDLTTIASKSRNDDDNDNTSIWSSDTELSVDNVVYNNRNTSNKRESFFKTIDGLSSGFSNESNSPVETVISDELSEPDNCPLATNFQSDISYLSKPIINSSRKLKDQIDSLETDLQKRQTKLTEAAKELAAKKLADQLNFKEKFSSDNSSSFVCQTQVELTQPLNIKSEQFPDLTRLSVQDEAIVSCQQSNLAAIRNRVGVDKTKRKVQDGLPEPDPMEFFDPKKHKFRSLNLSFPLNSINLKPSLSLASDRLSSIYRDRDLLNTYF